MTTASGWKTIGIVLAALLALGVISDKTRPIAIWIAVFVAVVLILTKFNGSGTGSAMQTAGMSTPAKTTGTANTPGTF